MNDKKVIPTRLQSHEMERSPDPRIVVGETTEQLADWVDVNKFTEAELTSIRSAAVVLLPDRGYGDYDGDVYPVQTEELYAHLTDRVFPLSTRLRIVTSSNSRFIPT